MPSTDGPMTMPATISTTTEGSRTRGKRPRTNGAANATTDTSSRLVSEGMCLSSSVSGDVDAEHGGQRAPGRDATQAVSAAKRVRGRGHRLEADELAAGRREDLRRRIALRERHRQ